MLQQFESVFFPLRMFMLEPSNGCLPIKYQVKPIKDHKAAYLKHNFLTLNIQLAAGYKNLNLALYKMYFPS